MTETFKQELLQLYTNYDKVTGVYTRKDGRQHIILSTSAKSCNRQKKTISYPKAIMEVVLKRLLTLDETIDHIDKNPLNNNLNNLQILSRSEHSKLDVKRRKPVVVNCTHCNKEFEATRNQLRKDRTGFFCSRQCSGKYGAGVQNKTQKKVKKEYTIEYFSNKQL